MRQEDQRFESSLSCAGRPHLPYHVPVFIQWLSCAAVKIQKQEGLSREMCLLRTQKLLTTTHTHTQLCDRSSAVLGNGRATVVLLVTG